MRVASKLISTWCALPLVNAATIAREEPLDRAIVTAAPQPPYENKTKKMTEKPERNPEKEGGVAVSSTRGRVAAGEVARR